MKKQTQWVAPQPRRGPRQPRGLRAVTYLIDQQMYFWGYDVLAETGNFLCRYGGERFQYAERAHKVHCYRFTTEEATIILHSTGLEFIPKDGRDGLIYLRPHHCLYHRPAQAEPFLPCDSARVAVPFRAVRKGDATAVLSDLLKWISQYEKEIEQGFDAAYRHDAWRQYREVPMASRWLPPVESNRWLHDWLKAPSLV
jgi:hypothetical protein